MSRRYSHSRQTLSSMYWMTFLIEVLCALVILVVSLEMVGRKHCSWRNPTGRNHTLPGRWVGRAAATDNTFCTWPPRSPDLTVCDFFLWGFVTDNVYVLPLPKTLPELWERINTAIGNVTQDVLENVWREWKYRLDICRVTRGEHIVCI